MCEHFQFIICRAGNHGLARGSGQAREATGGEADHNEWSDVCFVEVMNVGWFIQVLVVMADFLR